MEDTKSKQEELINELKNLIEILKMITRDNQGTHFNSSRQICDTTKIRKNPLSKEKKKSKVNKKC